VREYLRYVQKNRSTFLVLLENGRMVDAVVEKSMALYHEKSVYNRKQESDYELLVQYACAGTFQMISYWLKKGDACSIGHITDLILDLML